MKTLESLFKGLEDGTITTLKIEKSSNERRGLFKLIVETKEMKIQQSWTYFNDFTDFMEYISEDSEPNSLFAKLQREPRTIE